MEDKSILVDEAFSHAVYTWVFISLAVISAFEIGWLLFAIFFAVACYHAYKFFNLMAEIAILLGAVNLK